MIARSKNVYFDQVSNRKFDKDNPHMFYAPLGKSISCEKRKLHIALARDRYLELKSRLLEVVEQALQNEEITGYKFFNEQDWHALLRLQKTQELLPSISRAMEAPGVIYLHNRIENDTKNRAAVLELSRKIEAILKFVPSCNPKWLMPCDILLGTHVYGRIAEVGGRYIASRDDAKGELAIAGEKDPTFIFLRKELRSIHQAIPAPGLLPTQSMIQPSSAAKSSGAGSSLQGEEKAVPGSKNPPASVRVLGFHSSGLS